MERLTEENWEHELENHPFFRTKPLKENEKLPELFEALQSIKYDDEEAPLEERVIAYKEDGNYHFKQKEYESAIKAFTKGIELKCSDDTLNSILYSNRASANFQLKNYRSCINDAKLALEKDGSNRKSILKIVLASINLGKFGEAKLYCLKGMEACNEDFNFFQAKLDIINMGLDIIKRKAEIRKVESEKKSYIKGSLKYALLKRNICLVSGELNYQNIIEPDQDISENELLLERFLLTDNTLIASPYSILYNQDTENLEHAFVSNKSCLYLEDNLSLRYNSMGIIHWPVLFLYPQYNQTDFISDFNEEETFEIYLKQMLPGHNHQDHPCWDSKFEYMINSVELFWEDKYHQKLIKIDKAKSLSDALYPIQQHPIHIQIPMLTFIILLKGSIFTHDYVEKYNNI